MKVKMLITQYKYAFVFSGVLFTVLLTTDFLVNRSDLSATTIFTMPALPDTEAATGSRTLSERASLHAYFDLFEQPEVNEQEAEQAATLERLSQEQQAQQQGVQRFLYVGHMRYEVVGIYHVSPAFVTLRAKNLDSNGTELVRLHKQEALGVYSLVALSAHAIEFKTAENRSVFLQLYLPNAVLTTADKTE